LAKWLINHNLGGVREDQQKDLEEKSKQKRQEYEQVAKEQAKEQEVQEKAQAEKEKKVDGFHKKFQESDDLEDHLQDLSDFLSVSFKREIEFYRNLLRLPLAILESSQSQEKKLMMKLMIKLM
jgi:flagellar motor protein MotB